MQIPNFPPDPNISFDDKLLGSDAENNGRTKNFVLANIFQLFFDNLPVQNGGVARITDGLSTQVTGDGSVLDPYRINVTGPPDGMFIEQGNRITITGIGSEDDPFVITGDVTQQTALGGTLLGRTSLGPGDPENIAPADVRALLETETSAQLDARDGDNRARANHTGTQTASTISDLISVVDARAGYNNDDWDTAFGWGDHEAVGYLTTETDPVFAASEASNITAGDIANIGNLSGTNTGDQNLAPYQLRSEKGNPSGYAPLNGAGIIDQAYLPSHLDDVLEFTDLASFPDPGEQGKLYIAKDSNYTYRWSGSTYIQVGGSDAPINTVFGRIGFVIAELGDYSAFYSQLGHQHTASEITDLASYRGFDPVYLGINDKAANTTLVDGFNRSSSGDRFNSFPIVDSNGVTEVGRYLDFHFTAVNTGDNDVRIFMDTPSSLTVTKDLKVSTVISAPTVRSRNPNNPEAFVFLGWTNNDPRIRLGGTGAGADGTFRLQGAGDLDKFTVNSNGKGTFYGGLEVTSGTSGNAILTIRADTDNNNENDNPYIQLVQDGGAIESRIGLNGDNGADFTGSLSNYLYFHNNVGTVYGFQWAVNGSNKMTLDSNGELTATNFILSSDERKKKDIRPFDDTVDIAFKNFVMNTDASGRRRVGVIAQELEKIAPDFVHTDELGFKSVSYIDLLCAKVAELQNRVEQLENSI